MAFWHMAFLAGMATLAIPVVIHLMFRMRRRRLVFSSLRFLRQSVLKQSRRLRLREWLLLLLRCAACVLTALAFARPYRPGSLAAGGGSALPEDVAVVLDDSPSLLAQEGAGLRWTRLLEKIRREAGAHPAGDRMALVLASEPARAEVELSGNFGAVLAALQRGRPPVRRGDLTQALNTAVELLAASPQPRRRVLVCSDLQANQTDRGAWAEAARKAAVAGRGITVQIEVPGDGQPGRLSNLALADVRPKSDVWIEGRPIPFAVRLTNFGGGERPDVRVRLMAEGKAVASRTVALGPHAPAEFEMSAFLPHAGEISGWAEIDAADVLPEDDRRYFALHLRDSLKVLAVEERLHERDVFLDEGYYVRMALDPRARGAETAAADAQAQNYVQVQTVAADLLTSASCAQADVIVLTGISSLTEAQLSVLEEAVRSGHNLILFTGRSDGRLVESFYNGPFWKDGHGLLPIRPGPLYAGNKAEGKHHQLGEFKAGHPLFSSFAGENEPPLRLPVYMRHFLGNAADAKAGSEPGADRTAPVRPAGEVLATFSDGTPFAVERVFGQGRVLMFTFAPRPEAADLPKRKAFVPLLHQAVRYLARVAVPSRRGLTVGETFEFADLGLPPETPVTLALPAAGGSGGAAEKAQMNLQAKDHPVCEAPGIFTATYKKGELQERAVFAGNLDARESDLNSEDLASLRAVFASNSTEKSAAGPAPEVRWDDERKAQAPDWRYFLAAALACLFLELLLRDFWRV